jgi:hypothetical protein
MIKKISLLLKTDGLMPIDDSLIFKIKKPNKHWRWEDPAALALSYKDVSDPIFIKEILKLDFIEKEIGFLSVCNNFEYRSKILKESKAFSFYSFWARSEHYWKLYKTYSFDSSDDCFDQMLADYNFLEKRSLLDAFKND